MINRCPNSNALSTIAKIIKIIINIFILSDFINIHGWTNPNPNVGGTGMPNVGGMAMVATISLIAYKLITPKHIKNDYEEVGDKYNSQKHIKSDFEEVPDKYNSDSLPFYFKKIQSSQTKV
eukprot:769917_1